MLGFLPSALQADVAAFAQAVRESPEYGEADLATEAALRRQPVHPGYYWDEHTQRFELRGEFADVPRRFLELATLAQRRSIGFGLVACGDLDDRATVLGFEDGDALRDWMLAHEYAPRNHAPTLRAQLRKAGFTLPLDTVEGLLAEALADIDGAEYDTLTMGTNAERQRTYAERRKAKGWCIRCPSYLAREARPGRTLCEQCHDRDTERVRAWRAKRKASAAA